MHDAMPQHRSLKEKQRQERENLILQVAEEVLLEKGYYETSMDEIAARVGIAKGTLYLHFARKEDLVFALLERELHTVLLMVEHANSMEGNAQEKLAFIFNSLYQELFGKRAQLDRKSTRLNSSHTVISYAVFCLKKKKIPGDNALTERKIGVPSRAHPDSARATNAGSSYVWHREHCMFRMSVRSLEPRLRVCLVE